jgi:hypothetical protein
MHACDHSPNIMFVCEARELIDLAFRSLGVLVERNQVANMLTEWLKNFPYQSVSESILAAIDESLDRHSQAVAGIVKRAHQLSPSAN